MITVLAVVVAAVAAVRGVWSPCGLSMLSSLNPMSEAARGHRFGLTASWYVAGGAVGGGLLGLGCAVAALGVGRLHPTSAWTWAPAGAAALVAVVSDSTLTRLALPVHPRQVDERWLSTYRRWIYAGGFGVQIGAGFATYIMTAAVYLTAVLAVLTGAPLTALLVGLVFGTVRGLAILVAAGARTPERLRAVMAALDRHDALSLRVVCTVDAGVATVAAEALGGPVAALSVGIVLGGVVLAGAVVGARPRRAVPTTA